MSAEEEDSVATAVATPTMGGLEPHDKGNVPWTGGRPKADWSRTPRQRRRSDS